MKRETQPLVRSVTSHDGTSIGYQSFGSGPGVVLVEGAMGRAENYRQLALALADQFTVHVPDRRGRGLSPRPYDASHSINHDVEDFNWLRVFDMVEFVCQPRPGWVSERQGKIG